MQTPHSPSWLVLYRRQSTQQQVGRAPRFTTKEEADRFARAFNRNRDDSTGNAVIACVHEVLVADLDQAAAALARAALEDELVDLGAPVLPPPPR